MLTWRWTRGADAIELTVKPGAWKTSQTVRVNDNPQPISSENKLSKQIVTFQLDGRPAEIEIRGGIFTPKARLTIDGEEIAVATAPPPPPAWVWAFVAACLAIPVVFMGGAIPGGAGVGAALGCIAVARTDLSLPAQLGICAAITAGAWVAVLLIARAIAG